MTADFTNVNDSAQAAWDSESRKSAYSTVADPDDDYCEGCDQSIVADANTADGFRCGCDDPANQPAAAPAHGFTYDVHDDQVAEEFFATMRRYGSSADSVDAMRETRRRFLEDCARGL